MSRPTIPAPGAPTDAGRPARAPGTSGAVRAADVPPDEPAALDRADRYCIIGAGPSGLAAARAFAEAGIPFEVVERAADVGGIWDMARDDTPMYESAHFISSRTQSAFAELPMPAHYPDYPGWRQVLSYIRDFADRFDLRRHVQFHTDVERVTSAGAQWDVHLRGGERRRYRGVVLAVGHNWEPRVPEVPGRFDGEIYHSLRYRSAEQFRGRRVLIVGGGNSACDIACDAAATARRALISMRRGYWFLPKHIFGQPTDAFFRSGPHLPMWLAQPLLTVLLRVLVGSPTRYGLPRPDHRVLESHPIVNSQLLHYLAHGDIAVKPDVAELAGDRVRFRDGSEEAVDVVVWATGYRAAIPCVAPEVLDPESRMADLFLNIFPAGHENLFVLGLFETDGAAYPIVSRQAALVAAVLRARGDDPAAAARFAALARGPRPDLTGGVKYLASPRHAIYVQFDEYEQYLDRLLRRLGAARHPARV